MLMVVMTINDEVDYSDDDYMVMTINVEVGYSDDDDDNKDVSFIFIIITVTCVS